MYDPGFSSRIPDPDFFTHPWSRGQKGTGSRIRNTGSALALHGASLPFSLES